MTTYTSVFGGDTVPPSEYAYRAVTLTTDTTFSWPDNSDGPNLIASIMEVTASSANLKLILPAANEVSTGRDILFKNIGAETFLVRDAGDNAVATVAAGESKYVYLTDNSTANGTWSVFTYGTGTSGADATALAGYGLEVLSSKLNQSMAVLDYSAGHTVTTVDRAALLKYTGGTTTWYVPDPTTLPDGFFFAVTNSGSGTLTVDAGTAGGTLDGASTKQLQPNESMLVVCDATAWYSVGYGRSTEFAFTQLAVDASALGATLTITSAQAANKLWYFYNTAASDVTVTIPAVASVYFLRVGGIGAGNELTFTTGSGATVAVSANQSYTIYCDGTNVVAAQTVAVTSTVALDDGTAAIPALGFSLDADTGLYRSTANTLGVAANGAMVATFSPTGMVLATDLAVTEGGTGRSLATAYALVAGGTTNTGAHQSLVVGATTELLVGGGAGALPVWTAATGSGAPVRATSPTLVTPALGTPTSGTLTNCTGLPISTGVAGLGAGVATFLATPSSANLATAVTNETGSGALVFANTPTLVTPVLGTPTSGTLTNCTGLPLSTGITGTLAIGNGGTGQTTATTAFDALAPTTTKGDLTAHNGTDNVRVGVGANGYVLAADSTATPGVAWKAAASLGALTLPVIPAQGGTGVANGANNTITFTGNYALGLTLTGATALTLPTSGTVLVDSNIGTTVQALLVSGTNLKEINGSSLLGSGSLTITASSVAPTISVVTGTSVTAAANTHYVLTNGSATTVTLPASPADGDIIWITVANALTTNIIARNGKSINGVAENMTIDNAYATVQLRYIDSTRMWRIL